MRSSLSSFGSGITIVTGTDTDVGKTVATAFLTRALLAEGRRVAVAKPAQTGVANGEPADLASIAYLSGLSVPHLYEWARLPEPLAPTTAARRAGIRLPSMNEVATRVGALSDRYDAVVVEGAGGLLVGLDDDGAGLLDLADVLREQERAVRFLVVTRSGLGTLNHTQLTVDRIRDAGHSTAGLMIGALPAQPDLAERCNLSDLENIAPVLAALPAGIGTDPSRLEQALSNYLRNYS